MDQRFLGTEEFVEDIRRDLNERPSFVYDISIDEIISEVGLVFNISKDLLYSNTRNRRGAFGRAVVGYLAKELANHPFKDTAAHFKRDPAVISKGIKDLEKRIGEDETIITAINMLRESLAKNRKNTHLVKPDPIYEIYERPVLRITLIQTLSFSQIYYVMSLINLMHTPPS